MNKKSLIKAATEKFIENNAIAAGREAERQVGEYLGLTLNGPLKWASVWHDIRVPRSDGPGKYEIDYLILTPFGAIVLEVKNFGGRVEIDKTSGRWIQTTSTMNKKIHECPLALTEKKCAALSDFLKRNGLDCDIDHIHIRLVLTNPHVVLSPELRKDERICWIDQLKESYDKLLPRKRGYFSLGRSPKVLRPFKEIKRQLSRLPTWDEIEMHGGKILRGDILKNVKTDVPSRQETAECSLMVPRHRFWGRLHPCLYFYKKRSFSIIRFRCRSSKVQNATIQIQLAGEQTIKEINVYNIGRIRYGWADDSYYKFK